MTTGIRVLAVALVFAAGPDALDAQEQRRPVCFHPRPLERCRAFPVFELTVTATAFSTSVRGGEGRDFPPAITGTFGGMVNVTRRLAVGGQLVHGLAQEFGNTGEVRVRLWTGGATAWDASLGYGTSRHEEPFNAGPAWDGRTRGHGPSASIAFVPAEFLSFVARARRVTDDEGMQRRGLMFGVQTGSWSAVGVTALTAALAAAFFLAGGASN